MIVKRISIENYGIIGKKLELGFPKSGRIGVFGPNESGKSTLFESVMFALYGPKGGRGAGESKEDLITWGKEKAKVSLTFEVGDKQYLVERTITRSGRRESAYFGRLLDEATRTCDESTIIKNGTEATEKIVNITKMDRKSFTKLVFIMQKDLDALKGISKGDRETLLNNVIGIEDFTLATKSVKEDLKKGESDLELLNLEFRNVSSRKDEYENKILERTQLDNELSQKKQEQEDRQSQLNSIQAERVNLDWLFDRNNCEERLKNTQSSLDQIQSSLRKIDDLQKRQNSLSQSIEKYYPIIERLNTTKKSFETLESKLSEAKASESKISSKLQSESQARHIAPQDVLLASKNIPLEKSRSIRTATIFLALAVLSLGLLAIISFAALIIAAVFVILSARAFRSYSKLDKLYTSTAEIKSLVDQASAATETRSSIEQEYSNLKKTQGFESSDVVSATLNSVSQELLEETGEASIEAASAVSRNLVDQISNLNSETTEDRRIGLEQTKNELEQKLEQLKLSKPENLDETVEYDEARHKWLKSEESRLNNELVILTGKVGTLGGSIQGLDKEIQERKQDAERYPTLERQLEETSRECEILRIVLREFDRTAQNLRSNVIPHAKLLLFEILPKLTEGRYADVEINDDLTFRVMSSSTGSYHNREIFSGGTQDQFLIALRLAFTRSVLSKRSGVERYALFMDESTASSDESRKQGIFGLLEYLNTMFPQIFVIAHEDISDSVNHYIVLKRDESGYTTIDRKSGEIQI